MAKHPEDELNRGGSAAGAQGSGLGCGGSRVAGVGPGGLAASLGGGRRLDHDGGSRT